MNHDLIIANGELDEDRIYKALAHPFRRQLLTWLKKPDEVFAQSAFDFRHGVPSNAIHARSGLSQSTVSAHVATLVEARLLVSTRMGQWILLARDEPVIRSFATRIGLNL